MSIKVVYNNCYGGFSISQACAERMASLGNKEAQTLLDSPHGFYGYLTDTPRHDLILVRVVEELGTAASGSSASLDVKEISGNKYIIREYDGSESVIEPENISWTIVQD